MKLTIEREKGFEPSTSTLARWCASDDSSEKLTVPSPQRGRKWPCMVLDRTSMGGKMGGSIRRLGQTLYFPRLS